MVLFLPPLPPCCSRVAAYKQGKPFIMPASCSILTRSSGTVKIFSSFLRARPLPSGVKKPNLCWPSWMKKKKAFFAEEGLPLLDFLCPHQKGEDGLTPPVRFEVREGGWREKSRAFGLLLISSFSFPKEGREREGGSGESRPMSWRHKTP